MKETKKAIKTTRTKKVASETKSPRAKKAKIDVDFASQIEVTAKANYMPDESDLDKNKFIWVYEITVKNNSDSIVQLLSRFWRIVDMSGKVEEVRGIGVIGLQPVIKPGREFIYTSYCQLDAPQGTMEGRYEFQDMEEEHVEVAIPKFILSAPSEITGSFRSLLH